ncbi:MAG: DNA polymerase III subunit chi [Neisseriaceae bacterium]
MEVYFYINLTNPVTFLCELLQKILDSSEGLVTILTEPDEAYQLELSDALWVAVPNSFLPNVISKDDESDNLPLSPILITANPLNVASSCAPIWINLSEKKLEAPFIKKQLLLFSAEAEELVKARKVYSYYLRKGHRLKYFDMSS